VLADAIRLPMDASALPAVADDVPLIVGIRPEHFSLAVAGDAGFTVRAEVVEPLGSDTLVFVRIGESEVVARLPPTVGAVAGTPLALSVNASRVHFFDPSNGLAVR
jgi:multiple sugar transport system ATP-binding protein